MAKQPRCLHCDKEFGFFRWRNRCEYCGLTLCGDCCSHTSELPKKVRVGDYAAYRVCNKCYPRVQRKLTPALRQEIDKDRRRRREREDDEYRERSWSDEEDRREDSSDYDVEIPDSIRIPDSWTQSSDDDL